MKPPTEGVAVVAAAVPEAVVVLVQVAEVLEQVAARIEQVAHEGEARLFPFHLAGVNPVEHEHDRQPQPARLLGRPHTRLREHEQRQSAAAR